MLGTVTLILFWIIAVFLIVVGGVWWYLNATFSPLHEAEVELVRRVRGKVSEDDSDAMGIFRVAQSVGDLLDNQNNRPKAITLFVVGVLLFVGLVLYAIW